MGRHTSEQANGVRSQNAPVGARRRENKALLSVACVCIGVHARVHTFGAERGLEALQERLVGVLEEAHEGRAQLAERVT